jgi:hypothetical protein
MKQKPIWLVLFIVLILLSQIVIATPPTPPCDEEIEDKEVYENIISSNDTIKQINEELEFYQIEVADCFVNEKVEITLYYKLPKNFSNYQIVYSDDLTLSYAKDGSIKILDGGEEKIFEYDEVIDTFESRVQEIENNARVQEFITKLNPTTGFLIDVNARISVNDGWIEYSQYSKLVRGYLLPNAINWSQFPEIKQAHEIIEQNLLINELSNCSIGKDGGHSYTTANFHDFEDSPWYLTVALICDCGWKDAFLQLNSDGSYERLEIESDWCNLESNNTPGFELILVLIAVVLVLFWQRRRI